MKIQSRHTAFHRPKVVHLSDEALELLCNGRVRKEIQLSEVSRVNLALLGSSHAGSDAVPAYRCRVTSRTGHTIEFRNVAYSSIGEVAVHDRDFLDMVAELHQRLQPYEHSIQFRQGSNAFYWLGWFGLLMAALLLLMIPCAIYIEGGVWAVLRKAWIIALVPSLVGGSFLPLIARGRSRFYSPDALPLEHLPVVCLLRPE